MAAHISARDTCRAVRRESVAQATVAPETQRHRSSLGGVFAVGAAPRSDRPHGCAAIRAGAAPGRGTSAPPAHEVRAFSSLRSRTAGPRPCPVRHTCLTRLMALSGGVGHRRTAVTGRAARHARSAHNVDTPRRVTACPRKKERHRSAALDVVRGCVRRASPPQPVRPHWRGPTGPGGRRSYPG